MQVLGFHHHAVKVRDVEQVAGFYRDVLGLAELARHHREDGSLRSIWLAIEPGGFLAVEALNATEPPPPPEPESLVEEPGWFLLALRIAPEARRDVEAELSRRGVAIVHRTRWTLYVRDPEGNRIGLSHHPHDAP